MDTLEKLREETDEYKNTLVLDFYEVKVFLQIVEDPDDYYYELVDTKGRTTLFSCVGRIIPLVDRLNKDDYNYLASVWNLNNDIQISEI